MENILLSSIPNKFILRRIKWLSQKCNLIPYFIKMIESTGTSEIIIELFKYYYKFPIPFDNLGSLFNISVQTDDFKK